MENLIPKFALPASTKMKGIILHWSAGPGAGTALDKKHYHFIVNQKPELLIGNHSVVDNENTGDGKYAAHTRGCNTGFIGLSMAGMLNAKQVPFDPGPQPITESQWRYTVRIAAILAEFYKIEVTPKTVLSHAEVQSTLGIKQAGKWDIAILPWQPKEFNTAKKVGDLFRAEVIHVIKNGPPIVLS